MAKKGTSEGKKRQYSKYVATGAYLKNRKMKLERHLKKFPNDETAKKALKDLTPASYRRRKSTHKIWSRETKEYAHDLRLLGEDGRKALKIEKPKIF